MILELCTGGSLQADLFVVVVLLVHTTSVEVAVSSHLFHLMSGCHPRRGQHVGRNARGGAAPWRARGPGKE